jgi:hypothetical protein
MTPFQAWYGEKPNYKDIPIWGCCMLVPHHEMKNSEDRASLGFFYGYDKSRSLLWWCYDSTDNVKHAHRARFLEIDPLRPYPSPGQQLLRLESSYKDGDVTFPDMIIDVGDRAHFESDPFVIQLPLPPVGTPLVIHLLYYETYHLTYVNHLDQDTACMNLPSNPSTQLWLMTL